MTHSEIRELLPLFVLRALDGTPDRDAVADHLASGCASCAAELAEHASTAAQLPGALPPVPPRAELRETLARRIAATPRSSGGAGAKVLSFPSRPVRRWQLGFAAAAALAAVALVAAFRLQDDARRERSAAREIERRLSDSEKGRAQLAALLARDREISDALAGGDFAVIALDAGKGEQGRGAIVWDRTRAKWILLASDLKPLPPEKSYELWCVGVTGEKMPAGTFRPDAQGFARHEIDLPRSAMRIAAGAVTLEPAAGVDAPTGPVVIAGNVRA
ncbi:MAG TPA: anti-sigma factor [bacterium]|nr:anti-sigma factor [bacterium]